MDKLTQLGFQSFLDALDGVAYITSPDDVIVAYGRPNWERFAIANSAPHLARPEEVLGRPLMDFVTGPEAQSAHEAAAEAVRSAREARVTYIHRCDAPDIRRELRMSITPILDEGELIGLLYQSVTLSEALRPWIRILSPPAPSAGNSQPLISLCSFCRCIRHPVDAADPAWITPEKYYELGLDDAAPVSHGICPNCWESIVMPMMTELRTMEAA